jgi:diketogulonate reductase-like aldo/keto reductase
MSYNKSSANNERFLRINDVRVPRFLYGTAWKEDRTESLTTLALGMGFRGIDTANQRKHYFEAAVGKAIAGAKARGMLSREQLFVQTKFTHRRGQDHRLPYDENAPVAAQVRQSMKVSLEHLGVDFVDSYILHGPTVRDGLAAADWAAWRTMEALHKDGLARLIGVSNMNLKQLQLLTAKAEIMPSFVQNRCYAVRAWDKPVRDFCAQHGIVYQGFSLLTANRQLANHPEVVDIAKRHGKGIDQVIFRFALDIGMIPLTGTTDARHMRADLDVFEFNLAPDEIRAIETAATAK